MGGDTEPNVCKVCGCWCHNGVVSCSYCELLEIALACVECKNYPCPSCPRPTKDKS
jgi:hypothetical protein